MGCKLDLPLGPSFRDAHIEADLQARLDEGRNVWAIGDVHGHLGTFRALMHRLKLNPEDRVVCLGDMIDRGPDSAGVIDFIRTHPQIICLKGNIEINPFYFDIQAVLKKQNITKLINFLSSTFLEIKTNVHPNLSGKINIQLEKMRNAYFNSGYLNFQIADSGIKLKNNLINIRNIGNLIIKDTLIYKDNENIIFASKLEINVQNQDQFYKRLSISKKNRVKIDKIFVILEKNLDKDIYTLSEIFINKDPNFKFTKDFLITIDKNRFDNFQKFRSSIQTEFEKFN